MTSDKVRSGSWLGRLAALTALVVAFSGCGASASTQTANTALVTSVVAVVVAGAQTVFTWRQARIAEDQRNSSVWPRLSFDRSVNIEKHEDADAGKERESVTFGVTNKGIGPAVVRAFRVTLDGVEVPGPAAFMSTVYGEKMPFSASSIVGEVLSPGEKLTAVGLEGDVEAMAPFRNAVIGALPGGAWRIGASVCYCSVFDQCWWEELDGEPVLTPSCPPLKPHPPSQARTWTW